MYVYKSLSFPCHNPKRSHARSWCTGWKARRVTQDKIEYDGTRGGFRGGGRAPPLKLEKNMIFLLKIVIFHTKYPKKFRASLRSAPLFSVRPPN